MKVSAVRAAVFAGAALCATAAAPGSTWANGDVFFEAEEIPGAPEYVVFGSVKDNKGNYLDNAVVTIDVSEPHLTYDAFTNVVGRFRTPDVGRAIIDVGFEVDPSKIAVTVYLPGYRMVQRLNRGKAGQKQGAIEMNFVMAKEDKAAATAKQ